MKCYYHSEVDAVNTCSNCGKAICQPDIVNVVGKVVCQQCVSTNKITTYVVAPPPIPTNALAIVSLGLGILGLISCFCVPISGSIFGFLAAILGYKARKQILESEENQQGMQLATIGMGLGIVEVAIGIIFFLCIGGVYGTGFLVSILESLEQQIR